MSLWSYNGIELEVDMGDADFQEIVENAFEKMHEDEVKILKAGKASAITRSYCQMFYNLYDNIFGAGTGEKLLGEKRNSGVCEECYESFIDLCQKQTTESNAKKARIVNKYAPNRAQRRAKKK